MNKKGNIDGFTLIEVSVSLFIGIILIFSTYSLWNISNNMFEENKAINEQRRIFDEVKYYITEELAFATDIYISDKLNGDDINLELKKMYFNFDEYEIYTEYKLLNENVFGKDFYMDNKILEESNQGVHTGFNIKSDDVISVTITIYNSKLNIETTETFDVRLNNIKLGEKIKEPVKYQNSSGYCIFYKK